MPGFNGTGPRGQGPGNGWGMGPCGAGLRRGGGRGRGRGFGLCSPGPVGAVPGQDEVTTLRQEANALKAELEAVQKRLAEREGAQP
jgi:hypothetical protein